MSIIFKLPSLLSLSLILCGRIHHAACVDAVDEAGVPQGHQDEQAVVMNTEDEGSSIGANGVSISGEIGTSAITARNAATKFTIIPGFTAGMPNEAAGLWLGTEKFITKNRNKLVHYCTRAIFNPTEGSNFLLWLSSDGKCDVRTVI